MRRLLTEEALRDVIADVVVAMERGDRSALYEGAKTLRYALDAVVHAAQADPVVAARYSGMSDAHRILDGKAREFERASRKDGGRWEGADALSIHCWLGAAAAHLQIVLWLAAEPAWLARMAA